MNSVVIAIVCFVTLFSLSNAQAGSWDVCSIQTTCPIRPACRARANGTLFHPGFFLSTHSWWLPYVYECTGGVNSGLLSEYYFYSQTDPGTYEEFPNPADPTDIWARLGGTIQNFRKADAQWKIKDCVLSGRHPAVPSDIKREFRAPVYTDPLTDAFIANNWYQYENLECTLVGQGFFAGAEVSITRFGPAAQLGEGANNKNLNYGLAVWLQYTATGPAQIETCTLATLPQGRHGDINIDIGVCTPCVCPPNAQAVNIDPRCLVGDYSKTVLVSGKAGKFTFNEEAGAPSC